MPWYLWLVYVIGLLALVGLWTLREGRASKHPSGGPAPEPAAPEPSTWLDTVVLHRLVVHTTDDRSFEGLVAVVAEDGLVLRTARLLRDQDPIDLAGEVWIPRAKVVFAQTMPAAQAD